MYTEEYIYQKTAFLLPGWTFKYTHTYDTKKHSVTEQVTVLEAYPHHILVTNGIYNYSILRKDLFLQSIKNGEYER